MNIPIKRCRWADADPLYIRYHDTEWGVPVHDDRTLFEFLVLEGAQAGLSWITILKKRENMRKAFSRFMPEKIIAYGSHEIDVLIRNEGIIRNRLKIESVIRNARAFLDVREEFGDFDSYIWRFVNGKPVRNSWKRVEDMPPETQESQAMSRDMKKRGFTFVGPKICYAFMQAVGMVNDHMTDCFRYHEV